MVNNEGRMFIVGPHENIFVEGWFSVTSGERVFGQEKSWILAAVHIADSSGTGLLVRDSAGVRGGHAF